MCVCVCVCTVHTPPSRRTGEQPLLPALGFWTIDTTSLDVWEPQGDHPDPRTFPLIPAFYASYGSSCLCPLPTSTQKEGPLTPEISASWKLPWPGLEMSDALSFSWSVYHLLVNEDSVGPTCGHVSLALCVCLCVLVF